MARPSKLTADVQAKLVLSIGKGASYALACRYAGISFQGFRNWMEAGAKAHTGRQRELLLAIERAEGEAALRWLDKIDAAMLEHWQAAAWKLERRYPHEYGRQVHEIEGSETAPLKIVIERVSKAIREDEMEG